MKRVFVRGEEANLTNYLAALTACEMVPVVSMDLSLAQDCDALLVPGGCDVDPCHYGQENTASVEIDPQRDRDELELIDRFVRMEKPILGICRGHQIINIALGGTLIQDLPDESHRKDEQTNMDRVHRVNVVHPFLSQLYGDTFISNSCHHQAVDRLGNGLTASCFSEDGVVEGFIHENGKIVGVQFHPERMSFALRRVDADDGESIFRAFAQMISENT